VTANNSAAARAVQEQETLLHIMIGDEATIRGPLCVCSTVSSHGHTPRDPKHNAAFGMTAYPG
jgi:hypothetical protein